MKEAIQKAIEGGWKVFYTTSTDEEQLYFALHDHDGPSEKEIVMDKEFWQCLGKSMGWKTSDLGDSICFLCSAEKSDKVECQFSSHHRYYNDKWRKCWHKFIDHIADGGDVNTFFNNLINK